MIPSVEGLLSELRYAARTIGRRPGFAAVAIATLALGIGATTAIFSIVNGVLLRPLPYEDPSNLVLVDREPVGSQSRPAGRPRSMSFPDLADIRDEAQSLASLVGYGMSSRTLTGFGEPVIVEVARVTEGVLGTFRATPVIGRDIRADEYGANAAQVIVIGHDFWVSRFGERPDVLGSTVTLNATTYEIVGVAPAGFDYPGNADVWIPRALNPDGCGRGCHTFVTVGRLAAGATLETAAAELALLGANLEGTFPETNTDKRFRIRELKQIVVGNVQQGLWIMLAAVALVLLIACANVANLLLARASTREGEIAVRAALGASGRRLARQVLVESGLLAVAGGTIGVVLAYGAVAVLRRLAAGTIPRADQIAIDTTVLLVALATVVFVTLAFGVFPALANARRTIVHGLGGIGRGAAVSGTSVRFRRLLLGGEVALSATLLIGAGLLFKTFGELYVVDVGFEKQDVVRFNVVLAAQDYPSAERMSQFYAALEPQIAAIPGVEAVGSMFGAPMGRGRASGDALVEGRPEAAPGEELSAAIRPITPGLIAALRIPVVRGRPLTDADNRLSAEPTALVNEEFVRQNFPNEDPIGKRVGVTVDMGYGSPLWRVVGVVKDVRFDALMTDANADIYMPHALFGPASLTVHVRTAPGAASVMPTIREVVRGIDPNVPVYRVETLTQVISNQVAPTRLYLTLVITFAITAAILAAIGLYGVVSFIVGQRHREIGIRIALGARRESIIGLVVRQGMRPAIIGLAGGLLLATLGGRLLEAVLFNVNPRDPAIFGGASALMFVVTLVAAAVPAIRASRVDPARVLDSE
ncbi:MAG: ABC transporter permease [Gemmatimonadales bacterium]